MFRTSGFILVLMLAGCNFGPQLGRAGSASPGQDGYLDFLNSDQLANLSSASARSNAQIGVAGLRALGVRLRGPVLTDRERRILRAAIKENLR